MGGRRRTRCWRTKDEDEELEEKLEEDEEEAEDEDDEEVEEVGHDRAERRHREAACCGASGGITTLSPSTTASSSSDDDDEEDEDVVESEEDEAVDDVLLLRRQGDEHAGAQATGQAGVIRLHTVRIALHGQPRSRPLHIARRHHPMSPPLPPHVTTASLLSPRAAALPMSDSPVLASRTPHPVDSNAPVISRHHFLPAARLRLLPLHT